MNLLRKIGVGLSALAVMAMPFKTLAVDTVHLETQTHVANVTGGVAPNYQKTVAAKNDDVVRVEVYYHNREEAGSGKVAQNLTVKIDAPTAPGATQVFKGIVSADNAASTVSDTATVTLADPNSHLAYIPGTASWRHNIGTDAAPNFVTQPISDSLVTGSAGLRLENEQPCFNFEATVIAEFRVETPSISLVKEVKVDGGSQGYTVTNTANPGDTLDYVLIVKNTSNQPLTQVQVGDILPAHETYVANSTVMVNSITGTAGKTLTDDRITKGGVTIDDMAINSTQYVYFKAKVDGVDAMPCGITSLKNAGYTKSAGSGQIVNYAITTVNKTCVVTPVCTQNCSPVTPPVTPPATPLPQTGAETGVAGAMGITGIGYSLRSYLRSKRSLLDSLRRK